MSEKEFVWLPKHLADKLNQLDTSEAQEAMVIELVNKKKLDITQEMEYLEDNLLVFKGVCLKHKNELSRIYEEETDKLEKLYDHCGDLNTKVIDSSHKLAKQLQPLQDTVSSLKNEVQVIKDTLGSLDVYGIDQFISMVDKVNAMDKSSKDMLKFLMKEYK